MPLFHIVILALIQGLTEFLPISSSGHLVLAHKALGHTDAAQDLMLDVAVHVGTLFAVLLYFRKDILSMFCGVLSFICRKQNKSGARLGGFVIVASVPVLIAGMVLHLNDDWLMRSVESTAWFTLIFGVLLWGVDRLKPAEKSLEDLTCKHAFFIGLAQIIALIPGASRSGVTMTMARWLGFTRVEAARFSLLLAVVAISGAGALGGLDLLETQDMALGIDVLLAVSLAFLSGLVAIALMMKWLSKASFTPFAIYRIILGGGMLIFVYSGMLS